MFAHWITVCSRIRHTQADNIYGALDAQQRNRGPAGAGASRVYGQVESFPLGVRFFNDDPFSQSCHSHNDGGEMNDLLFDLSEYQDIFEDDVHIGV